MGVILGPKGRKNQAVLANVAHEFLPSREQCVIEGMDAA
jgi:hypothetical protein